MSQQVAPVEQTSDAVPPPLRLVPDSRPSARWWSGPVSLPVGADELVGAGERVGGLAAIRAEADDVPAQLTPTPGAVRPDPELPEIREWAAVLAVGVLQVLCGRRPLAQLERWLSAGAAVNLSAAAAVRRRRRAGRTGTEAQPANRTHVRSVHVQCLAPRVAEVAVHVATGEFSSAMALRLEGAGRRWRCTALAVEPVRDRTASEPV